MSSKTERLIEDLEIFRPEIERLEADLDAWRARRNRTIRELGVRADAPSFTKIGQIAGVSKTIVLRAMKGG